MNAQETIKQNADIHAFIDTLCLDFTSVDVTARADSLIIGDMYHYQVTLSSKTHSMRFYYSMSKGHTTKPALIDVLYSLAMDSYVLNSDGFEDWASNYGYDVDSRKDEKIYKVCIQQSLEFRKLIGRENLKKLQEIYQDY